ncbi:MAG: alpha/beta fold hydrolase [Alphaproteobacteria bacterium]|nr:alpha/beta fold hydrolase [Alphaproteobacteria bacterium]
MTPDQPLDPEPHRLLLGGHALSLTEEGRGRPVLLVHGLPGGVRDWRWLAPALLDQDPGLRLIRLDMPGFGGSDAALAPPAMDGLAGFLERVLDRLELASVVVIGHSFGTAIAVALAARCPDRVAALGLIAPIGPQPHRGYRATPAPRVLGAASAVPVLGDRLLAGLLRQAMVKGGFPRSTTRGDAQRTFQVLGAFRFDDHRQRLADVRCPTLLAWAEDDRLVEPERVVELEGCLPAGGRLPFDSGGHNLQKTRAVEIAEGMAGLVSSLG